MTTEQSDTGVSAATTDTADDLLARGRAAVLAGDLYAARGLFREAIELGGERPDALIGLSTAVPVLAEKRDLLRRALAISPEHAEARASLAYVEKLLAAGMVIAPSMTARPSARSIAEAPAEPAEQPATLPADAKCYVHPDREAGLLCTQCGRPICAACTRVAAVGQLCPDCRRVRRPVNYQVERRHVIAAALAMLPLAVIIGGLLVPIGFGSFYGGLILGWLAGEGAVRLSDRLTRGKRGRPMQLAVCGAIVVGTLAGASWPSLLVLIYAGVTHMDLAAEGISMGMLLGGMLLSPAMWVYALAAAVTAGARLR